MSARYLPLVIVVSFYLGTFILYLSNVFIEYPRVNTAVLVLFIIEVIFAILLGYNLGSRFSIPKDDYEKQLRMFPIIGFWTAVIIFIPSIKIYTDQEISSLFDLIWDPAGAYQQLQQTLRNTSRYERHWFLLTKLAFGPFIITTIPYFSYTYFRYKKNGYKLLIVIILMGLASVFRGTDTQNFDAFVLLFSGYLIARSTKGAKKKSARKPLFSHKLFTRRNIIIYISVILLAVSFSLRRADRLGDSDFSCFYGTEICHELSIGGYVSPLSVGVIMFTRYLTQGYHGLAIAFDGEFSSGFGMGHSRPLQYLGKYFGLNFDDVLITQLDYLGWSSRGIWSSGYVWIGNDVPLLLVPVIMFIFAFFLSLSWKESIQNNNLLPKVIFSYLFFTLIYMPGNLNLAHQGAEYIGFLALFILYIFRTISKSIRSKHSSHYNYIIPPTHPLDGTSQQPMKTTHNPLQHRGP